jgi:formylglycine-generating enzyme required for sulfatase activity
MMLWLVCGPCLAQVVCGIPKLAPSADALAFLERVQVAVGVGQGTILLYASWSELVGSLGGALSIECPGGAASERWIVYDPHLIKGDGLYFALAHETAHHVNYDPSSGGSPSKEKELRADGLAARYLARPPLNWTSQRLTQALNSLPLPKEASGIYPSLAERRSQVRESYAEESARLSPSPDQSSNRSGAVATPPQVAKRKEVSSKDGLTYVFIPPGQFVMGCSPGDAQCAPDEGRGQEISVTKGFWIGQTEVTQRAYEKVIGNNPSSFKGAERPVENVSWNDADRYCRAVGGRLPTEAEWEYAARSGREAVRYGEIDRIAWYSDNSGGETHEVARKAPNDWGLYDMLGNVWEWTADWYADKLPESEAEPRGASSGEFRSVRGGAWGFDSSYVRASSRYKSDPRGRYNVLGVRCVSDFQP